jgi:hypothetical protein
MVFLFNVSGYNTVSVRVRDMRRDLCLEGLVVNNLALELAVSVGFELASAGCVSQASSQAEECWVLHFTNDM